MLTLGDLEDVCRVDEQLAYDLVGISIDDGRVSVAIGCEKIVGLWSRNFMDLSIDYALHNDGRTSAYHFDLSNYASRAEALDDVCEWVRNQTKTVKYVTVGCYGPFVDIKNRSSDTYGLLATTSHGEMSGENLYLDFGKRLFGQQDPHQWPLKIETDVAVLTAGYIYLRTLPPNANQLDNQTLALISAGEGIGGTVIKVTQREDWKGDLHPEFGQLGVPMWPGDPTYQTPLYRRSNYTHSIEGIASIPAIEQLCQQGFDTLKHHGSHPVWMREAWYLAQLAWTVTCIACPNKIVCSGPIMQVPELPQKIVSFYRMIRGECPTPSYPAMLDEDTYFEFDYSSFLPLYNNLQVRDIGAIGALCIATMESLDRKPVSIGFQQAVKT